MICNRCGNTLPDGVSFCIFCGEEFLDSNSKDSIKKNKFDKTAEAVKCPCCGHVGIPRRERIYSGRRFLLLFSWKDLFIFLIGNFVFLFAGSVYIIIAIIYRHYKYNKKIKKCSNCGEVLFL